MTAFLDHTYSEWLCDRIDPDGVYSELSDLLYVTKFVWLVPNDDNRISDGIDVRYDFLDDLDLPEDDYWLGLECSMLELIYILCRRLEFETDNSIWFWYTRLLENVGLINPRENPNDILKRVIWRTYDDDGNGGFFPLRDPPQDQRYVELWYQMNAYILEHY